MSCDCNPYTLPTFSFVGGSTQKLVFHNFFLDNKRPFDLTSCTADFSIVNYVNRGGSPVLCKSMEIASGDMDDGRAIPNLLKVTLLPSETYKLEGKYIYQISIKANAEEVDIPSQGIIYITNNIHKDYITTG